jgi:intracellular septation protein A
VRHHPGVDEPAEGSPPAALFDLADAIGGPLGMLETSLPAVAFVAAYAASGSDTRTAAIVAVGLAVVLAALRLARRQTPRHAVSGLVGVAFAAFIAVHSGRAQNFFLPGLLLNAAYASAFLVSIVVRRPLVGVIIGQLDRTGGAWREDPRRLRSYNRASYLWVGVFLLRLVVELPLYLAGAVLALGVARTATGLPLFALGLWITWLLVRGARVATAPAGA